MRKGFASPTVAFLIAAAAAGCNGCRSNTDPELLFERGEELRRTYDKKARQEAITNYREALKIFERTAAHLKAAMAAQRIGETSEQLGLLKDSLRAYEQALTFARKASSPLVESEVRSALGFALATAGDNDRGLIGAQSHCEIALSLARQSSGIRQEAAALKCLGEVNYHRGDLDVALSFYRRAEPLWNQIGDRRGEAETQLLQGYVYSDLSELERARNRYESALSLWNAIDDKRGRAIAMVADARLRHRRGEYQEALNRYLDAIELLEAMGDTIWEASSLTGIADVYLQMAEVDLALKYWERGLQLVDAAGMKTATADVLIAVGDTYLVKGDDQRALDRFQRALGLAEELGDIRLQAYALRRLGAIYVRRQLPGQAREYLERSLKIQATVGDRRLEAEIRGDMGDVYDLLGEHDRAVTWFQDALGLCRNAGDRLGEARALFGLARASIGLNDLDRARRYAERSTEAAESLRLQVQRADLRASYLASVHRYYELHVGVLMRLDRVRPHSGMAAAAFEIAERSRARSLLESLNQAGVDRRAEVPLDLLERETAIVRGFDEWAERQRGSNGSPKGTRAEAANEYRDLEDRYNQIQAEIRTKSPRYAALTQPAPLTLAEVQKQVLDDKTLLIEYALGEERSFLWAVSSTDHVSYELPPQREIESLAQQVYERLTARLRGAGVVDRVRRIERADDEYWNAAQRLSEILLGPVATRMRGKRLLVVAEGALQYLPFAALPVPGTKNHRVPLVLEHEVVSLPSASVLAILRKETRSRTPAEGVVAVFADPVFESDDPRLRMGNSGRQARTRREAMATDTAGAALRAAFLRDGTLNIPRLAATRLEADTILAAAPEGTRLKAVDFNASRSTVLSPDLAKYRILHFATHGVFNSDQPGLGGIILSMYDKEGRTQDGFLRLHDIYNLKLPAELVVLSACNTALGKSIKGEGLVGIVRGFMYAGAKRVVASHWKVDDEATAELMGRFYVEMFRQNRTPSAALREAQLAMLRTERWQSPFYWAAFVLQGEWN